MTATLPHVPDSRIGTPTIPTTASAHLGNVWNQHDHTAQQDDIPRCICGHVGSARVGGARLTGGFDGQQDPAMEVFLETERLVLRHFTAADEDNLVELDSDPQVMRFITGGRATSREEIRDEVLPAFLGYYDRYPGYGFWAVVEKATGQFLGWFHLRPAPEGGRPGEPELGYRLRRSAWGNGYATEGSGALIHKAFAELGAERVFAETMVVNTASRRVMEKAGLELVRTFHQDWPDKIDGDEHGDVEYALTRAQWEHARRA